MVAIEVTDKQIADTLAALSGLRGYRDLTAGGKTSLSNVLRKYADSLEHAKAIVERWLELHPEIPTPFDLRELAEQTPLPSVMASASRSRTEDCQACNGTGFDSFDLLVYRLEIPGRDKHEKWSLRLAPGGWQKLNTVPRDEQAWGNIPDALLHPSAVQPRDRLRRELAANPDRLTEYAVIPVAQACACRRIPN